MRKFSKLNEDIRSFEEKISGKYKSLKRGILELIDGTIDSSELVKYQNFIDDYLKDKGVILEGFIEDNDIFDFYLKYKGDIDECLVDSKFFDESPNNFDVFSLYDYIIVGTKRSVEICMEVIQDEMF